MGQRWLEELCGSVLELVFPGECLLCGQELRGRCQPLFPVCEACIESLAPVSAARRCRVCSAPLISENETCIRCRNRSFAFDACIALYEYRGDVRELLYQYKFLDRRRVSRVLGHLLGREYRRRFGNLPAVPVPGSPRGVRRRGWDPMRRVAGVMAGMHDIVVLDLLRRGASEEQKGLGFGARLANLEGAMRLRPGSPPVPAALVLVDDIFTTGATTSECARLLRTSGASRIEVLVLAID